MAIRLPFRVQGEEFYADPSRAADASVTRIHHSRSFDFASPCVYARKSRNKSRAGEEHECGATWAVE